MLSFFAFSAFNCEDGDGVKLRIIATGGNFSGYYVINGGNEEPFMGTLADSGLYKFNMNLGTFRFIEITATKVSDNSSISMDMFLYDQNGNLLQKVTNPSCVTANNRPSTEYCKNSSSMSYTLRSGN